MEVTIDISMYPNREKFIPPIEGFIERINQYDHLRLLHSQLARWFRVIMSMLCRRYKKPLLTVIKNLIWQSM